MIGSVADVEAEGEFDFASDSSDEDYHLPIPDLPPRQHDHMAGAPLPQILPYLPYLRA